MKAKEKAKELIEKLLLFQPLIPDYDREGQAKQCALICVDEMIEMLEKIIKIDFADEYNFLKQEVLSLEEVKQEINKQ